MTVVPSPRIYKALKEQLEEIASELKRFENSLEMSSEFIELMDYTIRIYERMGTGDGAPPLEGTG